MFTLKLVRTSDKSGKIIHVSEQWTDASHYYYSEGNMSCDCNRHDLFEGSYSGEHPCGETAYRIPIAIVHGKIIEIDFPKHSR